MLKNKIKFKNKSIFLKADASRSFFLPFFTYGIRNALQFSTWLNDRGLCVFGCTHYAHMYALKGVTAYRQASCV